ncbi:queuosine precursor transporter [Candidatus Saccharibacteria bacterium]|nr:queuosine precursor transporter [Candidatus Saccharibacteria bacterium]
MKISKSTLFMIVVALSVTVLIVSNIASTKLFDFFGTGLVWDGGAILFPLAYVLGDVVVEIYGFKVARKIVLVTFAMNLLAVLALWIVQILPPGVGWGNQAAYEAIIGFMPRLVAGSLVAYAVGQIANAFVFAKIKVATKGRRLWLRALGSSLVGNLIDTLIFVSVAFYGVISPVQFVGLICIAYATKMIGETLLLPVTYRAVKFMKKVTGDDHYDKKLRLRNVFFK